MGSGIAQVCATAGYNILLHDVAPHQIEQALETIKASCKKMEERNSLKDSPEKILARITATEDIAKFETCDLVIESATENEQIKKDIFRTLTTICPRETYFATNTSSISITRLASVTDRPERFIGMHFMNPVPLIPLIEVIRGLATSQETFELVTQIAAKLEKTTAVAEDFPAFIVNRVLMPMVNESIYVLYEGVGNVEAIDRAMTLGTRHPMGPLALADFIGLDTCLAIMQVLYEGLADSKYRPCPLLVKYVEAGWLGRKTGRGFYDYSGPNPVPTR